MWSQGNNEAGNLIKGVPFSRAKQQEQLREDVDDLIAVVTVQPERSQGGAASAA